MQKGCPFSQPATLTKLLYLKAFETLQRDEMNTELNLPLSPHLLSVFRIGVNTYHMII